MGIRERLTGQGRAARGRRGAGGVELECAIRAGELVVHYQPKVGSRTLRVAGVEALVRWQHPTRGLLGPAAFLPTAEAAGLMPALTMTVLASALDQVQAWRADGRDLAVAVNLPASCLRERLAGRVLAQLAERGLPGECLELEITEESLVAERAQAREFLTRLRARGLRVSVDDFGTGYSCLAYLRELPIDQLKLDRSLVQPMVEDPRAAAIVTSTIELAHALGVTVVAEGVEDESTAQQLAASGCDESQGFLFSPALPAGQVELWLDRQAPYGMLAPAEPSVAELLSA